MSNIEERSFLKKIENDPLPAFGIVGLLGVVGFSLFNYRRRDQSVRTSVYVIHTRMAAQGFVIALLTGGVCYKMINNIINKKSSSIEDKTTETKK